MASKTSLSALHDDILQCRICVTAPRGQPLPHAPRPVLRVHHEAKLAIAGQAPGTRVHASGVPFTDPSGDRLRAWLNVSPEEFYDRRKVAIIPMGFCFPGLNEKGADLPPRKECAPAWRSRLLAAMPNIKLIVLVGGYAQRWHLDGDGGKSVTETVLNWRQYLDPRSDGMRYLPVPHPSWRNNHWLKSNPWFERELLPVLQQEVSCLIRDWGGKVIPVRRA